MLDSRVVLTILHWNSVWMVFAFNFFATDFEQEPLVTDHHVIYSPTLHMNGELRLHAQHWEGLRDWQDQQSPAHNLKRKPTQ